MSIQTLSYHAFLVEMDWLFDVLNEHVERIGWQVASHQLNVPRIPRRVGREVVPFYLAGDLRSLFEFARGSKDVSEDFVEETIDRVIELLFTSPLDAGKSRRRRRAEPDWSRLEGRALGLILRAARGRARIEAGEWPQLTEVEALTGMSQSRLERSGVELKTDRKKRTLCEPRAVARLLQRVDKDDDDNV